MNTSSTTAVAVPSRFERRREHTRQELLAAATRVLAEKGLDRTKITDIAAAADVGVGTFYLHFPDKEALFDAVVEETVRRLKATVDAAREKARGPLARSVHGCLQAAHGLLDDGVEERLLVGEMQVEGADADVGRGRDVRDLGPVEALLGQHPGGGRQELLARVLAPALEATGYRDGRR